MNDPIESRDTTSPRATASRAKSGRKSKLTPQLAKRLLGYLAEGNTVRTATALAGLGESTFYEWLSEGQCPNADPRKVEFAEAVKKAGAVAERRAVAVIRKAALKNWQAAAWFLERRHSDDWGRRGIVAGPGDGSPKPTTQPQIVFYIPKSGRDDAPATG